MSALERAAALRAELKALEVQEREESREREKQKEAAYKALPIQWFVKQALYKDFVSDEPAIPAVHVMCCREDAAYSVFVAEFGHHTDRNRMHGMVYHRTDENILTSYGGGSHILKTPKLCSDDEWALICAGQIPDKFKKGW